MNHPSAGRETKKKIMAGFALFPLFADARRGASISPLDYVLYV